MFLLISASHWWTVLLGIVLMGLVLVTFSSTMPSTIPALFPTGVRYGGVSVGYNLSVALFGGTTQLISEALIAGTGSKMASAFFLVVAGVIGVVATLPAPESARRALPDAAPTASSI